MNKGLVEQAGAPLDIYERPASTFVASFIGAPPMNLIPVAAGDGAPQADGVTGGRGLGVPAGGAILGIRPEHLMVVEGQVPEDSVGLTFPVSAVEAVGAETFVYGPIGGTGQDIIARFPGKALLAPGTPVSVAATAEHLHLFDKDTGKRIGP